MVQEVNRKILLLGSGFVAGPCLNYLAKNPNYTITVASLELKESQDLCEPYPHNTEATEVNISDENSLHPLVERNEIVISLVPYTFHLKVLEACLKFKKHMVTTSYISELMQKQNERVKDAGITVLNEIGLDPGIDHLYAVKTIDEVHSRGGKILEFISYCGGLPAPTSNDNPMGYKFSWSSKGVLLALQNTATYLKDQKLVKVEGGIDLMNCEEKIDIVDDLITVGYPNRDSTVYRAKYDIPECNTCLRGTLRYKGFTSIIKLLINLGLFNSNENHHLTEKSSPISWLEFTSSLLDCSPEQSQVLQRLVAKCDISSLPENEADELLKAVTWLGLASELPVVKKGGNCLDTLCYLLESKMKYAEGESDMVLLQHSFKVENADGSKELVTTTMQKFGEPFPKGPSAMATCVGYPCAIGVDLILDGTISQRGVLAPVTPSIANPILERLEATGIKCIEKSTPIQ